MFGAEKQKHVEKTKAHQKNYKNINMMSFGKVGKFDMNWNAILTALLCMVIFFKQKRSQR